MLQLYGCERARMMCEWARNFVLRTGRLPTDEETCDSLAVLLEAPLPGAREGPSTLDIQQWLLCYPPEAPRLVYRRPPGGTGPAVYRLESNDQIFQCQHAKPTCQNLGRRALLNAQRQRELRRGSANSSGPGQASTGSQPALYQYFPCDGGPRSIYALTTEAAPLQHMVETPAVRAPRMNGIAAAAARAPSGSRSLREQEAELAWDFPELASLSKLTKPKARIKRRKVGKKPHSGVRGMYFQQGSWKVRIQFKHNASKSRIEDARRLPTQFSAATLCSCLAGKLPRSKRGKFKGLSLSSWSTSRLGHTVIFKYRRAGDSWRKI